LAAVAPYDAQSVKHNLHDVDPKDPNLYRALRNAGYQVLGCGKFDLLKASMNWGENGHHGDGPDADLFRLGFTDGIDNAGKHDFVAGHEKGRSEPFQAFLRKHGLLIRDGAKISKSRGNVILPDQYIQRYGADTFRMYLMFLGPFQKVGDFRARDLAGPERFLKKVWYSVDGALETGRTGFDDPRVERALHATIRQVTQHIEALRYNKAIAAMMDYLNKLRFEGRTASVDEVRPLIILLAPVAPHIAEELWERLGGKPSIFDHARWPVWDRRKLRVNMVELPVQVNGKLRAKVRVARGAPKKIVQEAALAEANVSRQLEGVEIRNVIHIPDRLLNLVVS